MAALAGFYSLAKAQRMQRLRQEVFFIFFANPLRSLRLCEIFNNPSLNERSECTWVKKIRTRPLSASERHTLDNPRLSERSECSLGIRSKGECPLRASERFRHVVCTYIKRYPIRLPLGYIEEHYVYVPLRGTESARLT